MMESQTLSYTSPLYGRRTGQIKLAHIPFRFYHDFIPEKDEKKLIEYYAVSGGVPKYIEILSDSKNIYDAIKTKIISKSGFLYDEPRFLIQREVSEVGNYFSLIKTIAAGNHKLSKIASVLEVKQTGLTKYLKTLIDLDILKREVPVTEENPEKSKRGLYKIKDNFFAFWFKFIFPYLSYIESGQTKTIMDRIKANFTDSHAAYVYEDLCIEKMWELNINRLWGFSFDKAGRWWNGIVEIDIIAIDKNGKNIIFGECKYRTGKTGLDVLVGLEVKSAQVDWYKNERKNYYILFSISGFTDELIKLAQVRNDLILTN